MNSLGLKQGWDELLHGEESFFAIAGSMDSG